MYKTSIFVLTTKTRKLIATNKLITDIFLSSNSLIRVIEFVI